MIRSPITSTKAIDGSRAYARVAVDGPGRPLNAGIFRYRTNGQAEEELVTIGGFSSKRLTRVRDVLSRHLDAGDVPGVVAVVARHGEVHIDAMGTIAFEGAGSGT